VHIINYGLFELKKSISLQEDLLNPIHLWWAGPTIQYAVVAEFWMFVLMGEMSFYSHRIHSTTAKVEIHTRQGYNSI
jgi:hypothetical protein